MDSTRQAYSPGCDDLVVSPETSRDILSLFIKKARKELLIYDPKVSDRLMLRLLAARAKAGVNIRMFGKLGRGASGIEARKLPDLRLHVRAIIRDGSTAFIGSQSLRKLELDGRREIGVVVSDEKIVKKMRDIFEADWGQTAESKQAATAAEKEKEKDKEKEKATSGA
jgi:cardiolipin synthase